MLRERMILIAAVGLAFVVLPFHWATGADSPTAKLIEHLSEICISSKYPVPLDKGGWRGVVVLAVAPSLDGLIQSHPSSGSPDATWSSYVDQVRAFDRTLIVQDGIGTLRRDSVALTWDRLIRQTYPATGTVVQPVATETPYSEMDSVDITRGLELKMTPLAEFRERRRSERTLIGKSLILGNSAWRNIPKLNEFPSLRELLLSRHFEDEMFAEIRSADAAVFMNRSRVNATAQLLDRYTGFADRLGVFRGIPFPILHPEPDTWDTMDSWQRVSVAYDDAFPPARMEFARVRMIRPWMDINGFLSDDLVLGKPLRGFGDSGTYTNGIAPSLLEYPSGAFAVVPEEMILIRHIDLGRSIGDSTFPLRFAYDVTNLAGFVVRVVPDK